MVVLYAILMQAAKELTIWVNGSKYCHSSDVNG
jgi:hypothetical protein